MRTLLLAIAVVLFAAVTAEAQYVVPNAAYGNFNGGYSYVYPQMVYPIRPVYPVYPVYGGGYGGGCAPLGDPGAGDFQPRLRNRFYMYNYTDSRGRMSSGTIFAY